MAVGLHRLNAKQVENQTKSGRHADGGNLYLNVSASGAKSWVFLYKFQGRQREMGLGRYGRPQDGGVPLARARELAAGARAMLVDGIDPLTERTKAATDVPTFWEVAKELMAAKETAWRNPAHRQQWRQTINDYAKPLHELPVDQITTEHVYRVLIPIWTDKNETASKLMGRIAAVLDAAKARGFRSGENPAQWRGNLQILLPPRKKLQRGHHRALPYSDVPMFVRDLKGSSSVAARALEFLIATAARSGEVLGARWDEMNFADAKWTVPKERMKGGLREHTKPLSNHAMTCLAAMQAIRCGEYVFPGARRDRPLSEMALEMVMRRTKARATPHGFRSSFKDWAAEETEFANEVSEMQLAHVVRSEVERAYRRGDLLEKRRALVDAWATYCLSAVDARPEIRLVRLEHV